MPVLGVCRQLHTSGRTFHWALTQPKPPSMGHVHRPQSQHSQLRWMWPSARAQIHHCPAQVGPSRALHHRHSRLALHEAAAGIRSMLEHRQGQVPQHHKCPLRVPHTGGRIRLGAGMGREVNTRHAIVRIIRNFSRRRGWAPRSS